MAGGLAGYFLAEPIETGEVVAQTALGIFVGVVENTDGTAPPAIANYGEE